MKKPFVVLCAALAVAALGVFLWQGSVYAHAGRLIDAICREDFPAVQEIVERYPDCVNSPETLLPRGFLALFDKRPTTPLLYACGTDDLEIIAFLVEHGADVNGSDGRTPLSLTYAGKRPNWYAVACYLIEHGADVNYRTEYSSRFSPVLRDIAAHRPGASLPGYEPESPEEVMAAFRYAMAHVDASQVDWAQSLFAAVSADRVDMIRELLDSGFCDVNMRFSGVTALMIAARDAEEETVKELIRLGADRQPTDDEGKTACDWAIRYGREELAQLLAP